MRLDLGLHLALAKVGDDATGIIVDENVGSLCRGHLRFNEVRFLQRGTRALRSPCNTPCL
jgi:hypothetical protein